MIESFVCSYLNYCPLVWHFCKKKSVQKIENITNRVLTYFHDDFESDYSEPPKKLNKTTMTAPPPDTGNKLNVHKAFQRRPGRLLNVLCTFNLCPVSMWSKTQVVSAKPRIMPNTFKLSSSNLAELKEQFLNLRTLKPNQVKLGEKSLRAICPKIWNSLPLISRLLRVFQHLKISQNPGTVTPGNFICVYFVYGDSLRSVTRLLPGSFSSVCATQYYLL